ncbi:MAG: peptidoglycan DD-metalloendopeptidase family protein [Candidatus Lindowbacteria bacterium]|nr:peptidoglycan DD-metalloendopeptidase family protein [Candidatus Lindowbacteria bacterium]
MVSALNIATFTADRFVRVCIVKNLSILFCLVALILVTSGESYAQKDVRRAQSNLKAQEKRASESKNEIERLKKRKKEILAKLKGNERKLALKENKVHRAEQEVRLQKIKVQRVENEIEGLSGDISYSSAKIRSYQKKLAVRANQLLKLSMQHRLETLSTSKDAAERELRIRMNEKVADASTELIEKTRHAKYQLQGQKTDKEESRNKLKNEQLHLTKKELALSKDRRDLIALRSKLRRAKARTDKQLALAEKQRKRVLAQIKSTKAKLVKLRKKYAKLGKFLQPVKGKWYRPFKQFKGIYFLGKEGKTVKSVANGEVVSVATFRGVGTNVVIGHGNDETTVYGNLSLVSVKEGQAVKKGTILGKTGTTPYGTGLMFAVYRKNKPLDTRKKLIR